MKKNQKSQVILNTFCTLTHPTAFGVCLLHFSDSFCFINSATILAYTKGVDGKVHDINLCHNSKTGE